MATAYARAQDTVPTAQELGIRLRTLREREHLTIHDIARRARMHDDEVRRFEEEGEITGHHLVKLIGMVSADRSFDGAFQEMARREIDLETLPGILDAWSEGQIDSREAIRRARLDGHADLLATAIENEVPLPTRLTPAEQAAAARFAGMEI